MRFGTSRILNEDGTLSYGVTSQDPVRIRRSGYSYYVNITEAVHELGLEQGDLVTIEVRYSCQED